MIRSLLKEVAAYLEGRSERSKFITILLSSHQGRPLPKLRTSDEWVPDKLLCSSTALGRSHVYHLSQPSGREVLWSGCTGWARRQIQIILKCCKCESLLPAGALPAPIALELSAPLPLTSLPTTSEDTATHTHRDTASGTAWEAGRGPRFSLSPWD